MFFILYFFSCNRIDDKEKSSNFQSNYKKKTTETFYYIGRDSCINCHNKEYELWKGSDHDLAMQEANERTILGDFNNTIFTKYGIISKFYNRDGKYYVFTEGPEGKPVEYEIAYTFGIRPLQQYLVEFPGGRYQMLPLCWDTRTRELGGQSWFHIYPDERIAPNDVLYWTKVNQNWNYMCAECHSTNVRKNYDQSNNRYNTTYSEIDVSCEACHGPGSKHIKWAKLLDREKGFSEQEMMGLRFRLKDPDKGTWVFNMETGNARRTVPLRSIQQIETCARCHSRRRVINENYIHGRPLLDAHVPSLLVEDLYYADGQIQDEVYVYGSFLQSKMFSKGVLCHDCHEPHSMRVYSQGNVLCYRCHLQRKFGAKSHHFHKSDSSGALCIECHMPERTYMVIDPRRDHSIRIPRPDLSEKIGSPNACNKCHKEKSNQWSIDHVNKWYGQDLVKNPHFGEILYTAQRGLPGAENSLSKLVSDTSKAKIVRATALWLLGRYPGQTSNKTLISALNHNDALIRYAALHSLDIVSPNDRLANAKHLLQDPLLAIRNEAVRVLASVSPGAYSPSRRKVFEDALNEYIECHMINADHYSTHLNLGTLYLNLKQFDKAEKSYKSAIRFEPNFIYSYINLADLYRLQNREDEGEQILIRALAIDSTSSNVHHAMGLLLARNKRLPEALKSLKKATELNPDNPNLSYVYSIALNSSGKTDSSVIMLEQAHQQHPNNVEILFAIVTIQRDRGLIDSAIKYARKLVLLAPKNPDYYQLLNRLESQK